MSQRDGLSFGAFGSTTDKNEGVNEQGETVTVERMHGCNGEKHVDTIHRIYRKGEEVVGAADLGFEERGRCDKTCEETKEFFPGSGFIYPLTDLQTGS